MCSPTLHLALQYAAYGWSLIPIRSGTKKAAGSWKRYQVLPAKEPKLREWFSNGQAYGIAVVLGKASGGTCCRDFDEQGSYDRWAAEHPDLAATLPTVATPRGRHVYFRADDHAFRDLGNGEYRGDGHYCLLPPSQHPSGPVYRWVVPLPDGPPPYIADVVAAGLLPSIAHVTERTEGTERTETTESTEDNGGVRSNGVSGRGCFPLPPTNCPVLSVASDSSDLDIERAILETIPSGIGRRNKQVFEFARALKGIPRFADAPVDALKPYVRHWHRMALDKGVIGTEPFDETWIDFLHAWPKVKFPKGNEPMVAVLQRAVDSPPPTVAQRYDSDGLRLLVAVCRELQRASGGKPFYLACRTAARLLGLGGESGHIKAWRWLDLLVHDSVIENVEPGERGRRRATRYRWIGEQR